MKVDIWMPLYIADYLADTSRLTTQEHGAYLLLLMDYWRNGPPPDDDRILSQITRMQTDAWSIARASLEQFFVIVDGTWKHERVERELQDARDKKAVLEQRARVAAEKRWGNRGIDASSNARGYAKPMLEECPSPSPSPSEKPIKTSSGNGLPPCPHAQIVELFHKTLPELPEVRIWNQTRQGFLKSRWREMATQEKWETVEQGIAWFEKFFAWLRQSKFLMGKVTPRAGARAFECELEWILRPQNWTKIIEGKYHAS